MSNLGWYQILTTMAKRVGGPRNLIMITVGGTALVYSGINATVNAIKEKINKTLEQKKQEEAAAIVHTVTAEGKSNEGLEFKIGDKFKVLEKHGKAVMIEILDDENSPYYVAADFLSSISDCCFE